MDNLETLAIMDLDIEQKKKHKKNPNIIKKFGKIGNNTRH